MLSDLHTDSMSALGPVKRGYIMHLSMHTPIYSQFEYLSLSTPTIKLIIVITNWTNSIKSNL